MNHVFEHLLDLDKDLGHIRTLIKPNGYLYLSMPGTYWWIKNVCKGNVLGILQNAHTYQFSLDLLVYVLRCHGFELVHGDEQIRALFRKTEIFYPRTNYPEGEIEKVTKYLKTRERWYTVRRYLKQIVRPFLKVSS